MLFIAFKGFLKVYTIELFLCFPVKRTIEDRSMKKKKVLQNSLFYSLPPLDASIFPSCEKVRHEVSLPNT